MEQYLEIAAFVLYFLSVLGVGIFFLVKRKNKGEKDYFLGGRNMNGLVAAFSAGASDMSAWVLMGLPGSIFLYGIGQIWISIGLLIGTVLAWIFVAPRLRKYSIVAKDSITIPEFLTNRFNTKSPLLRVSCAVIFVIAYCVYTASSLAACGDLFSLVLGLDKNISMSIAAVVIVGYTLMGGFNAVCWTDFIQGLIMFMALSIVPIVASFALKASGSLGTVVTPDNYYSLLSSGSFDWNSIANILTGLGWGLGYFGMPHILVRYMSIRSKKEMKKSQIIGIIWIVIILVTSAAVALVAHQYLGDSLPAEDKNLVFVTMVRKIFGVGALALFGGLLLSAIVAAAMSTADSQLLASSSAFSSDIYKTVIKKNASDKEMLWVGRITVAVVIVIALLIALFGSSDIMSLVSAAWSIFGAAFGPVILLALFWRRFNYKGAVAGIITGFVVSILWMVFFNLEYYGFNSVIFNTQLYELVPGFVVGLIVSFVVTLCTKAPTKEVVELFDSVKEFEKETPNNSVEETVA